MEKKSGDVISAKIVEGVQSALAEIDELRVQLALGKSEALELYDLNKKKFHGFIQDMENTFNELKKDEAILPIVNSFEILRIQLALGKAESKAVFEEQFHKISQALHQLESELKTNSNFSEKYARIHLELEKFKLKLELFALHYKLKKISVQFDLENRKAELAEKLEALKAKMALKQKEGKEKWENFQEEIQEAYEHLKSAFKH